MACLWSMEVIVATVLPNAILVALPTLYLLQHLGPNKLEQGPGYTGTRLDGYAPKIWPQILASTRGGDSQIWRVLVGREYLQGDNSTVHSTRQHVGKWEVRKAVSILARNVINRLLIPKLLWGTPCPTRELDRDPKLVT